MKIKFPKFCQLCGNPMTEKEAQAGIWCTKCKNSPMWWVIEYYGRKEKHELQNN